MRWPSARRRRDGPEPSAKARRPLAHELLPGREAARACRPCLVRRPGATITGPSGSAKSSSATSSPGKGVGRLRWIDSLGQSGVEPPHSNRHVECGIGAWCLDEHARGVGAARNRDRTFARRRAIEQGGRAGRDLLDLLRQPARARSGDAAGRGRRHGRLHRVDLQPGKPVRRLHRDDPGGLRAVRARSRRGRRAAARACDPRRATTSARTSGRGRRRTRRCPRPVRSSTPACARGTSKFTSTPACAAPTIPATAPPRSRMRS